jgi:hypothetical protein
VQTTQEEQENFIGISIPDDVQVHSPNDIPLKGKCKRILGHGDKKKKKKDSAPRKCTTCKDVGHDRRNCPKKRFLQFRTYISDFVPLCIGFFTTAAELAVAVYS